MESLFKEESKNFVQQIIAHVVRKFDTNFTNTDLENVKTDFKVIRR